MDSQQILQLIFSGILALATIGLMVFTIALWIATNKYRKATEDMAEIQEEVSAIQKQALKINQANLILHIIEERLYPDEIIKELRKKAENLCQDINKDIEVEQQN